MYELVQVSEKCYYINCPAKIGVYVADSANVYLIDSGNDKDAGRKVRKILSENGWNLKGIINTHSNADHMEETNIYSSKQDVKYLQMALRWHLQGILYWSRHFCMADTLAKI